MRHAAEVKQYAIYATLFYMCVYGLIATNALFGSSYVLAVSLALVGSWFAGFLGPGLRPTSRKPARA